MAKNRDKKKDKSKDKNKDKIINKKKTTLKAGSNSKTSKLISAKGSLHPKVINKGPKGKVDLKKKEVKLTVKFDKAQKFSSKPMQKSLRKSMMETKPKGFSSPARAGFKAPKKEIRIEQSSKQEYLSKKELKKKENEKSQQLKKGLAKAVDISPKVKMTSLTASESNKAKKGDSKVVAPAGGRKSKKPAKEENELDDVFIDDVGSNEIEEYEEDLKAVEDLDNETEDDLLLEAEVKEKKYEDIELTDADGNKLCRSRDCDQIATVDGYCRFHYLLFWKNIQIRKRILTDGKLERYIEELTSRYSDKFIEMIRRDLRNQKDFLAAIQELEIDEANVDNDFEEESQNFIDEVRGVNEGSSIEEEFE